MQAAYPVMAQMLGDEAFAMLARDFWRAHPPVRGDLAQWGAELGDWVQGHAQLAGEPFLGDVARVEWALHRAASAADLEPQPATFALLSTMEPDGLTLQLSSGTRVVSSAYPVASIVAAHLHGNPTLEVVGARLRAGEGESAVVWRQGFKPQVAPCSAAEADFVRALQSGASLLSALAQAGNLDFNPWLTSAVQNGLVLGARPLGNPWSEPS